MQHLRHVKTCAIANTVFEKLISTVLSDMVQCNESFNAVSL